VVRQLIDDPGTSADFAQLIDLTEASDTAITGDHGRQIAASSLDPVTP